MQLLLSDEDEQNQKNMATIALIPGLLIRITGIRLWLTQ